MAESRSAACRQGLDRQCRSPPLRSRRFHVHQLTDQAVGLIVEALGVAAILGCGIIHGW
ncbi:hypothetical protein [Kribbia dieselivorans]|uniref:hypothetical protein n=1 Tax=Kribbia dieselivorans TaxID=331526 RepID=UPI0012ED3BE5|nr:hypothetical protein [Kribbia dieselivorans]